MPRLFPVRWGLGLAAILASALPASTVRAEVVCTAFADAASGQVLHQAGNCDRRFPPASTFKIPIALMGYDAGILEDENAPAWPFREGYPDWVLSWRQTTDPAAFMKNSVVWYSQQITQRLGAARFERYVADFGYGNGDVSGDPGENNGLTRAWLSSSLQISPVEQLAFLGRLVRGELPVGAKAVDMTGRLVAAGAVADGWQVYGKTGMGYPKNADGSLDRDRAFGWYVGWASRDNRTVVFARLEQDNRREDTPTSFRARDALLKQLPAILAAQ